MNVYTKILEAVSVLCVVLGLAAGIYYYRSEYMEAVALSNARGDEIVRLSTALDGQIELFKNREDVAEQVIQIRKEFATVRDTVQSNQAKFDRAIKQVKENDQAAREYLAQPIPDSVGRLFVRPATTDPRLYRSPDYESGAVQSSTVQTSGVGSTPHK
jgi:hypothetical protein